MPRPKVRPEDRQRSSRACQTCKALKIRCDSRQPCASCLRREQPHACIYSGTDRRRRRQGVLPRYSHTHAIDQGGCPSNLDINSEHDTSFQLGGLFSGVVTPESRSDDHPPVQAGLPEQTSGPSKVYVGETSSLSFLHFLRKTIKGYVGSVPFTDCERYHTVLEADARPLPSLNLNATSEKITSWINHYHEATSGILDLFTAHEIQTLLTARDLPSKCASHHSVSREDAAAMDVAIAIGAQVSGSEEHINLINLANGYFYRARRLAFDDMLMGQSLGTVRLFLLMSFYMLGACHRNAASMFLGIAARAAIVLDLHSPDSYLDAVPKEERDNRQRIWHSTRNLDVLSSFVMSRPKSLPVVRCVPNAIESADAESAFHAIVEGCTLLEDIVDTLSKDKILHVPAAEDLLARLRQWSQGLPITLRQFRFHQAADSSSAIGSADRQHLIGNIHVSCVYYFAVILVTRPYLIAYLTSRLHGKAPDHLISDPDEASDVNIKNNKVSKLAQVCVSSALYMVDMCQRAKAAGLAFGNLCLLKAWIFGAGLVLGFAMFAGEPRRDIETIFDNAIDLLDDIGRTSPQARLYHQILTSFSEAVTRFRHRVAGEVRRTVQHYMDQILVIDPPVDVAAAATGARHGVYDGWEDEWAAGAILGLDASCDALDPVSEGTKGAQTLLQLAGFRDQSEWDEIDVSLAEGLFPVTEPFDQLFYTVE